VRPDLRRALRVEAAPPDEDQTAWLVTFSDLVLQLFAFVLVSVMVAGATPPPAAAPAAPARAPADAPGERSTPPPAPARVERLAAVGRTLREMVAAEGREDAVQVSVRDSGLVVTLNDAITFPSGSADLLPAGVPILRHIAALARAMPDFDLAVDGHTDDVPIHTGGFPSNLELSLARAARVVHELAVEAPELADRMAAAGWGEHRPVASNADEAGRARNRRVEIRLVPRGDDG
jgi:chemotaxis protein MotB